MVGRSPVALGERKLSGTTTKTAGFGNLIYDIQNHEAVEPELNDYYFPFYRDIGEKASTPMTDQTHVTLLEAILRFDGLDNFELVLMRAFRD